MHLPFLPRQLVHRDDGVADSGKLDVDDAGVRAERSHFELRVAVAGCLNFHSELVGVARSVTSRQEDIILAVVRSVVGHAARSPLGQRVGEVSRRADHRPRQRVISITRHVIGIAPADVVPVRNVNLRRKGKVTGHELKSHRSAIVLIPARRVRFLHHSTSLRRVDVVHVELIGIPALDVINSLPLIRRRSVVKLVAQASDRSCR